MCDNVIIYSTYDIKSWQPLNGKGYKRATDTFVKQQGWHLFSQLSIVIYGIHQRFLLCRVYRYNDIIAA